MFGLVRLVIFAGIAFVAGVLFERNDQRTACETAGTWKNGICLVTEIPDG
jgi:hypothetical protein